jgi:hypothetical protein
MLENPLAAWLERKNMRAYTFARKAGIASRTAYRVAYDDTVKTTVDVMLKIEAATDREVTVRKLIAWANRPPLPEPPRHETETVEVEADEYEDADSTEEPD